MRAAVLLAAALVPAAAEAQDVGRFPRDTRREYQSDVSAELGRCLASRDRKDAVAMVMASDDAGQVAARKHAMQSMVGCLNGRMSATLNGMQTAGAVAEALLTERDGVLLAHAASLAPVAPVRVGPDAGAQAVIGCAAGADPADAVAMLRAPAESPAEMAAFQKMGPALQACVPATGAVSLKPQYIRSMTAVSLYRHVTAGAAGGVQ